MTDERVAEARAQLPAWSAQAEDAFRTLAEVLGVPVDDGLRDPTTLLPHVAALLAELPLDELTDDDWKALHLQLVAFVGQVLIRRSHARW
jgi:outer membrane protein TolC